MPQWEAKLETRQEVGEELSLETQCCDTNACDLIHSYYCYYYCYIPHRKGVEEKI